MGRKDGEAFGGGAFLSRHFTCLSSSAVPHRVAACRSSSHRKPNKERGIRPSRARWRRAASPRKQVVARMGFPFRRGTGWPARHWLTQTHHPPSCGPSSSRPGIPHFVARTTPPRRPRPEGDAAGRGEDGPARGPAPSRGRGGGGSRAGRAGPGHAGPAAGGGGGGGGGGEAGPGSAGGASGAGRGQQEGAGEEGTPRRVGWLFVFPREMLFVDPRVRAGRLGLVQLDAPPARAPGAASPTGGNGFPVRP